VLEVLVHGNIGRVPRGFRYAVADIPDDERIATIDAAAVPGWDSLPPGPSRRFGTDWLHRCEALVLPVPSVVTNGVDQSAVVNPLPADFARTAVGEEPSVRWDARLPAPA
jgi:RES domain-containing protein